MLWEKKLEDKTFINNDGLPAHKNADPLCKICNGFGVVDEGNNYGPIFIKCECVKNETNKRKYYKQKL